MFLAVGVGKAEGDLNMLDVSSYNLCSSPIDGKQPLPARSMHVLHPRGSTMKHRVLIVDDEALLVRTLSQAFRDAGFEVLSADSAEAAQDLLVSEDPFDLLVIDNRLPKKSGLELLAEIGRPNGMRIVLMTAYDTDETYKQSVRLGADLYLKKPFDLKALLSKAAELVTKRAGA